MRQKNKPFLKAGSLLLLCFFLQTRPLQSAGFSNDLNANVSRETSPPQTIQQDNLLTNTALNNDTEEDEEIKWDGTVVWNGVKFTGKYDNTVSNCSLGRVNTQYGIFQSYVKDVETDADAGKITGELAVKYGHGVTDKYPYQYAVFQTHVLANSDYLQFWHGSRTLSGSECDDSNAYCEENFTIDVNDQDAFDKNVGNPFLSGGDKKAFIILRGVDQKYGNSLDYVKKFQDAEFSVWLDSTAVGADGEVTANAASNFNGKDEVDYDVVVYYTIGVYDPDYISVTNIDVNKEDLSCDDNDFCSDEQNVEISGIAPAATISETSIDNGDAFPMFVGLKSWGFDEDSEVYEEVRRIRSGARLLSYSNSGKSAVVRAFGETFRDDCNLTSDGSVRWRTNELSYRIISCKDTSVCQAIYSLEEGEEEAWTQKIWNSIKQGFEIVFEAIGDAAEDVGHWFEEAWQDAGEFIDKIGDTIGGVVFPGNVAYPENEVLVVLKAGNDIDALTDPAENGTIKGVYEDHGTPVVTKEFSFEEQEEVDTHVENSILQPYDVRGLLRSFGMDATLVNDLPPLHRFYVLRFTGINENERDDIIEELSAADRIQEVSANYLDKLDAPPNGPLYSSSLTWFQPYLQTWWPEINDATSLGLLAILNPEEIHKGVDLLYPAENVSSFARVSAPIGFVRDPALIATHFQFPGTAPYPKDTCSDYSNRDGFVATPVPVTPQIATPATPVNGTIKKSGASGIVFDTTVTPNAKATPKKISQSLISKSVKKTVSKKSNLKTTAPQTKIQKNSGKTISTPTPKAPTAVTQPSSTAKISVTPTSKNISKTTTSTAPSTTLKSPVPKKSVTGLDKTIKPPTVKKIQSSCLKDEIIVKYTEDTLKNRRLEIEDAVGLKKIQRFRLTDSFHYEITDGEGVEATLDELEDYSEIFYAHPNTSSQIALLPNDPQVSSKSAWHHFFTKDTNEGIKTPEAWNYTVGDTNVIVAVLDTGNKTLHPDYYHTSGMNLYYSTVEGDTLAYEDEDGNGCGDACCYFEEKFSGCEDLDGNGFKGDMFGWNFFSKTALVEDYHGHGTTVAGIIGAAGNNGIDTAGVAWAVTILPLKVSASLTSYTSDIIAAIDYAAMKGAKIVNMSLGGAVANAGEEDAIRRASSILFVAAAGNDFQDLDITNQYPSGYNLDNIISVGASAKTGVPAGFSNYSPTQVDLSAPGEDIISLDFTAIPGISSGNRGYGTSYSAPMVSGVAALMYSACQGMTPTKIKDILIKTVTKNSAFDSANAAGGILNAKEALEECLNLNNDNPDDDKDDDCPQEATCEAAGATDEASCSAAGGTWATGMFGTPGCFCCGVPDYGSSMPSCTLNKTGKAGQNDIATGLIIAIAGIFLVAVSLFKRSCVFQAASVCATQEKSRPKPPRPAS